MDNKPAYGIFNTSEHKAIAAQIPRSRSIVLHPRKIYFANQNSNEEVFILVRAHWSRNIQWVLNGVFYFILPILIYLLINSFSINISFLTNIIGSTAYLIMIVIFYYSIIISSMFRDLVDWYFDPYIVTNERIVHYEFRPFSGYEIMEAPLVNIEDVTEKSKGFWASIFGYGNVSIRTASQAQPFVFKYVPHPTLIRNIITDLSQIIKKTKENGNQH